MERIYIRIYYLKALHYFFFSLAVFSIGAGIIFFDFATFESMIFLALGSFYCAASLVVAYYFYKDYKETLEPFRIIKFYFIPYIVLLLWTMGSTLLLILLMPSLLSLIYSFLFIDYYVFFLIVIGFILSRFRLVSRLFEMYNDFVLRNAKKIAKQYAYLVDVSEYKISSNPEIDEILDDIWVHKDYPLPYIRKFEIALCERHIININRILGRMRKAETSDSEKRIMEAFEKEKDLHLERIRKIQEKID